MAPTMAEESQMRVRDPPAYRAIAGLFSTDDHCTRKLVCVAGQGRWAVWNHYVQSLISFRKEK